MFSYNSNSSFQQAIKELKLNNNQVKKKIINISINKAPTPVYHQKSTNMVDAYKETSEKIRMKNFSKQKKIVNINLDDSKQSTSKIRFNLNSQQQNKWKAPQTTKNNPTMKIDYGAINMNYLITDYGESSQNSMNVNKLNSDSNAKINNTGLHPRNYSSVVTINDSLTNSNNMQITYSQRNYITDTFSYLNTDSNSNNMKINQTINDSNKIFINKNESTNDVLKEKERIKSKCSIDFNTNKNSVVINNPVANHLKTNNSICDINKIMSNNNNPMNLNKKISSLLTQLNSNNNKNKKISFPIQSKILNNLKQNNTENITSSNCLLQNNLTSKKFMIDTKNFEFNKGNNIDAKKRISQMNNFSNLTDFIPFPLSTKNEPSKILKNSNQYKNFFEEKEVKTKEEYRRHNTKSNSRCKVDFNNKQNDSVPKQKSKIDLQKNENYKSTSIINVKQKYKELMKNKSIPASLMIKNFKLSSENNSNIINSNKDEFKLTKANNLKEKICNRLKMLNDNKFFERETKKQNLMDDPEVKIDQDYKKTIDSLKENNKANIIIPINSYDPRKETIDTYKQNFDEINRSNDVKESDDFDDMNSIVKRLRFDEINVNKESIFSDNNFLYKNFEAKFYSDYDNFIYPNFKRK